MNPLALPTLLQDATAVVTGASPTSVGEWLAIIVTGLTIIGGAFKLGAIAQRINGFENTVVRKLDEFIASSTDARQDWAAWRATTESRLGRVEQDQSTATDARHDIRNALTTVESRVTTLEGDRRNGPAERRTP